MGSIRLDEATAERMGYPDAVAAVTLPDGDSQIELALLPPESHIGSGRWAVVAHYDCDPDMPDRGASGVETCGTDQSVAEDYYLSRIEEISDELDEQAARRSGRTI